MTLEQLLDVDDRLLGNTVKEVQEFARTRGRSRRLVGKLFPPLKENENVTKARALYDWMQDRFAVLSTGPASPNLVFASKDDKSLLDRARNLAPYQGKDLSGHYVASEFGIAVTYAVLARKLGLDAHVVFYDVAMPSAHRVCGVEVAVDGDNEPLQVAPSSHYLQGVGFSIKRKLVGATTPSEEGVAALVNAHQLEWLRSDTSVGIAESLEHHYKDLADAIRYYRMAIKELGTDVPTLNEFAYALKRASRHLKDPAKEAEYTQMLTQVLGRIVTTPTKHYLIHEHAKRDLEALQASQVQQLVTRGDAK